MSELLTIPVDLQAEEGLAGVAVSSARGYTLAANRGVAASHFYVPACRRLFSVGGEMADLSGISHESIKARIQEASRRAGVPVAEVQRLRDCRPVMFDTAGSLAKRVLRAAQARSVMSLCDSIYSRLGSGERVDVVLEDLAPNVRQLLGISA